MSISTAAPASFRSEVEVLADAVVALMAAKLLPTTPETLKGACETLHIPLAAVRDAKWRHENSCTIRPRLSPVEPLPALRPPVHRDSGRNGSMNLQEKNRREWEKKNPLPGLRVCPYPGATTHKPGEAIPVDLFGIDRGNNRSGTRFQKYKSKCKVCQELYRRSRMVWVKTGQRAIIVEIVEGDDFVGHACGACQEPFEVGQKVRGDDLRHEGCPGSTKSDPNA